MLSLSCMPIFFFFFFSSPQHKVSPIGMTKQATAYYIAATCYITAAVKNITRPIIILDMLGACCKKRYLALLPKVLQEATVLSLIFLFGLEGWTTTGWAVKDPAEANTKLPTMINEKYGVREARGAGSVAKNAPELTIMQALTW